MSAFLGAGLGLKAVGDIVSAHQQGEASKEALAAQEAAAQNAQINANQAAVNAQNLIGGAQGQQETALTQGFGGAAGTVGQYGDYAAQLLDQYGGQAEGAIGSQLASIGGGRLAGMLDQGYSGFEADPGYQFRREQGEQAINRSAAARGGRLGGDVLKELANFNSGLASQEFQNYANRQNQLMGLSGQVDAGTAGAYGNLANLYTGQGSQLANLSSGIGAQLAGLETGQGTSLANMYSQNAANISNAFTGAAGAGTNLAQSMIPQYQAPTQYAGQGAAALGNTAMNLATLGYMGSQGGDFQYSNGMTPEQMNAIDSSRGY